MAGSGVYRYHKQLFRILLRERDRVASFGLIRRSNFTFIEYTPVSALLFSHAEAFSLKILKSF